MPRRDPEAAELRARRGDLEVADLRDRDVRELRLQPPADVADRQVKVARGFGRGAHFVMKLNRYLPIWTSSPLSSRVPLSIRLRLTNVPFRLPRSSIR